MRSQNHIRIIAKSQRGFSLIQMIIAMSMMVVVVLSMGTLLEITMRTEQTIKYQTESVAINHLAQKILKSKKNCEASFNGMDLLPNVPDVGGLHRKAINELKFASGATVLKDGAPPAGNITAIKSLGVTYGDADMRTVNTNYHIIDGRFMIETETRAGVFGSKIWSPLRHGIPVRFRVDNLTDRNIMNCSTDPSATDPGGAGDDGTNESCNNQQFGQPTGWPGIIICKKDNDSKESAFYYTRTDQNGRVKYSNIDSGGLEYFADGSFKDANDTGSKTNCKDKSISQHCTGP